VTPPPSGASSDGLNSNIAAVLAYSLGCISGIVLLIVERRNRYVRFHAMQSTLTFLAVLVMAMIVGSVPVVGRLLVVLLSSMTSVVWLVLMFKAFTGQRYQLPYLGAIAERAIG